MGILDGLRSVEDKALRSLRKRDANDPANYDKLNPDYQDVAERNLGKVERFQDMGGYGDPTISSPKFYKNRNK